MSKKDKKNINGSYERRYLHTSEGSEVRVVRKDGEPVRLVGYFAKFGKMSRNLGWFREIIERGFFSDALKRADFDALDLFNHDSNFVLGRVSSGTLKVREDKVGLYFECTPPDTQLVKDMVLTPIERGDIRGCSFGFRVKKNGDMWDEDEEGRLIRTLLKNGCSELREGSQVAFPAYPDTSVALRSMESWKEGKDKQKQDELEQRQKMEQEQQEKEERENKNIINLDKMKRKKKELERKSKLLSIS